jgi:predicted MFS family arabinose efflux permease
VAAALCFLNVLFAWRYLPESKGGGQRPERSVRDAVWQVVRHPAAPQPRLIWIYAVGMGAFTSLSAVVALYLNFRFGITERTIGWVFVYIGALSVVMRAVVLGRLVDRFGETRVMRTGAIMLGLGMLLYTVPGSLWMLAFVIPLVPMGTALLFPSVTALSSHHSDARELGQMMGVQQAFGGIARVVAPIVATSLYQHLSPRDPFFAAATVMLLVTLLAFRVPSRREAPAQAAAAAGG